ncbi:hypothetical protein B0H14DRAFT_3490076 [Mycena olivaceomarginata]|nr:hypothetical protein B0H14DRAFT_3490076 [Mycena olivaceomarginata]
MTTAVAIGEWSDKMCKDDAPLIKMGMAWPATALNNELVTIKELEGGRCAKAMFPTAGSHRQEAVFTIVGALKAKELPPVKASRQPESRTFKKALENMQEAAYTMFSASISSNCRYFTIGRNIPSESQTKFHPRTDPHGVLTRYLSDNVAHCFDNDVMYMAFKGEEYVEKDPGTFKTGDIVEMRTLTFLDRRFTKEAHFAREAYKAKQVKTRAADDRGHADNHIPKRRMMSTPDSDDEYGASTSKRMHMLTIVDGTTRNSTPAGAD